MPFAVFSLLSWNGTYYVLAEIYAPKKHQDKNSLFALEKPADWSYDFFHW